MIPDVPGSAAEITAIAEETLKAVALSLRDHGANAFALEARRALAPLRRILTGSEEHGGSGGLVDLEKRIEEKLTGLGYAITNALLAPLPPGADPAHDTAWEPFYNEMRKAVSPLRMLIHRGEETTQALIARLDRATRSEIELRADLVRLEFRAAGAEKDARETEARFAKREQRRAKDEDIQRRLLDESEAENGKLRTLLDGAAAEKDSLRAENARLGEELAAARDTLAQVSASRWIRLGTRLGLSKLGRHLGS